ncbi:MAG: HAMP domain-containing sensor histidine kinase [Anaerocolumna sp.]
MKKYNFLDGHYIFVIGFLVFALYIINVVFVSFTIKTSYSERIISTFGAMSETYGDINKEVVDSVLNNNRETYREGKQILKKYGYNLSGNTLIENSLNQEVLSIVIFTFSIILFLLTSLYFMFQNHMKFLERLDVCLEDFDNPAAPFKESNPFTKNLMDKLHKLSLNSKHNISLIQKEKEKIHEFMDDLSHQMKTPLTVAHLCIERYIFENTKLKTDKLEDGLKQLEKMTLLINSYLKIGMLKSYNTKLEVENYNVLNFLDECAGDVQPLLDNKDMNLSINGDTKEYFQFDSFWLKEAIINLLKNSVEHSPEGSEITIDFQKGSHEIKIQIIDQGNGIEEKNLPLLFERFLSSIRQKDGSNGLGLAIAKQAILRHFGQIGIRNNKESGVTFEIRLPILKGKEVYNNYYDVR